MTFVYHLVRHGTRYPTAESLKRMRMIEDDFVQSLVSKHFTDHSHLTKGGQEEMYRLGQRMRSKYPILFKQEYHPDRYDFMSSQVLRSLQSADAYVFGLFDGR